MLPKPNAPGLALVQITGPAEDVELLFDAIATATGWTPATTVEAAPIPFEDDTNAQTWSVYLRPESRSHARNG